MGSPAPEMYEEHATPTPRPRGSLPCLCFQPEPSTTFSMHGPSPIVPIFSQFAVTEFGGWSMFRRISAGSRPSSWAALSSCTSTPNRGCGVPCPRFGPQGALFVKTRTPSKR